jgi:hypothetical protein
MDRAPVLLLCAVLLPAACATAREPRIHSVPDARVVLAEFARQLPARSRVTARVAYKGTLRGTLLKVTDDSIVLQTELVEEVPFDRLLALELDVAGNGGRASLTATLAASAIAGAALGVVVMLVLISSF